MSALDEAVIEIDADVNDDGTEETGVFRMVGNISVNMNVERNYFLGPNLGAAVNAIFNRVSNGQVGKPRQGFAFDIGGGANVIEIDFLGWDGATDKDGNSIQWGASSSTAVQDETSATGADAYEQMQVFMRYLQYASADSFAPARLYTGGYTDGTYGDVGRFGEPLDVAIQGPRAIKSNEDFSQFNGALRCVEIIRLDEPIDALEQVGF